MEIKPFDEDDSRDIGLNALAWKFAKAMGKLPVDKSDCNKKVWCKRCEQYYCLGHDMVEQFCSDCFYKPYYVGEVFIPNCQKEITGGRLCKSCQREVDNARSNV